MRGGANIAQIFIKQGMVWLNICGVVTMLEVTHSRHIKIYKNIKY